jgi:hypothetical protein
MFLRRKSTSSVRGSMSSVTVFPFTVSVTWVMAPPIHMRLLRGSDAHSRRQRHPSIFAC